MEQIKVFWQSLHQHKEGGKSARDKFLLLALAGLLLLVIMWPVDDRSKKEAGGTASMPDEERETDDYASLMEQRLQTILASVEGAGKVQVMLTVKGSSEQIVEKDKSYSETKNGQSAAESGAASGSSVSRSESTVYSSTSGGSPYIVKEMQPEVEGILVVAEGADDEKVVNEITYAVQVLFDVPIHKIKVVKMSNQ